ncbi:PHP domain-containing protein [Natronoflexus pectinivorans]|uniref:Putative metal-dependent phosphoesterase TrpH n=1 Tax=Natronoflexus pectinivorans TaxID=682526 RepID=A0A4R2GJZ2_9BACT|nr:PHP domain-containing protein [Natronoflexus pectinivorans]TCO07730.1 putative metal-dependent phosphoesterase TrpH [Natronoflexus pectinivorans]
MNYYLKFPDKATLLQKAEDIQDWKSVKVNSHLHTPYSFSAFDSVPQALDMALKQGVRVVGINDFYTTNGYPEWASECNKRGLFPLFNIEFISLNKEDQANGIRVNDPNNPGRTYLSGKGLSYPFKLDNPWLQQLLDVRNESNRHVESMCQKLNGILESIKSPFNLSFSEIEKEMTNGNVRERHLAKALRLKVEERFSSLEEKLAFYHELFGGKDLKSSLDDFAAVENEIRGNLLKAGGGAFVPEDPKAFLEMETVRQIILQAGGIPTYPFLADDANGNFTDFENDLEKVAEILKSRGIASVEFITTRNSVYVLEKYAGYLYDNGFAVTFGSEHNSPAMEPIELFARNITPLTDRLKEINLRGAALIATHQFFVSKGEQGYVNKDGMADVSKREEFEKIGRAIISLA